MLLMDAVRTEVALGPLNPVEQKFAPAQLWLDGDIGLLRHHPRVAVIGTRAPTSLGAARTRKLVRSLVSHRATVVSGLAAGVDTIAHAEAMQLGGRTIAVIGTPLDQTYPKENAELQRRIAATHLVVSEFRPGSKVARGNFPRRNRTMALIADASVIIEAGETSGTLSQGWEALRLGRPLFLLRSLLDGRLSWPAKMVEYGALPLDRIEDLLAILPADGTFDALPF
ncbi:MAG TPA: DNA-processing protein DprA [Myxococcota bacterium]|nr:DNA-processing protein DprA [Myxococcota bacterium]